MVAPTDLAASMGHLANIQHAAVQGTIDDALAGIQAAGRVAGTLVNNQNVSKYVEAGVRFLLTQVKPWLSAGAAEFMTNAENATRQE